MEKRNPAVYVHPQLYSDHDYDDDLPLSEHYKCKFSKCLSPPLAPYLHGVEWKASEKDCVLTEDRPEHTAQCTSYILRSRTNSKTRNQDQGRPQGEMSNFASDSNLENDVMRILGDSDDDDDDDDQLPLSVLIWGDNRSGHHSCPQQIPPLVQSVQDKVTEDRVEKKISSPECIEISSCLDILPSPCSSDISPPSTRSKRRDRRRNDPRRKMNNFTFDDHLENIWASLSEDKKPSFALLDSMCFILYQMGRESGLNIIKRKDVFSKKYVLVPIVCWSHWRLAVFCHLGESALSESRTRCILLLDSLEMGAREIECHIRKFVFDIFKAEGRPEIKDDIEQIPILTPEVPQQSNDVDCGRFVLYFIQKFLDTAPENFSCSNGYPYFMTPDWFSDENFEEFCKKLANKESQSESGVDIEPAGPERRSQRIRNKNAAQRQQRLPSLAQNDVVWID